MYRGEPLDTVPISAGSTFEPASARHGPFGNSVTTPSGDTANVDRFMQSFFGGPNERQRAEEGRHHRQNLRRRAEEEHRRNRPSFEDKTTAWEAVKESIGPLAGWFALSGEEQERLKHEHRANSREIKVTGITPEQNVAEFYGWAKEMYGEHVKEILGIFDYYLGPYASGGSASPSARSFSYRGGNSSPSRRRDEGNQGGSGLFDIFSSAFQSSSSSKGHDQRQSGGRGYDREGDRGYGGGNSGYRYESEQSPRGAYTDSRRDGYDRRERGRESYGGGRGGGEASPSASSIVQSAASWFFGH